MDKLINSNNEQYKVNEQIGKRLTAITTAIKDVIEKNAKNKIVLNELDTITTIMKIDTMNKLLEDIAEAIILSKLSITSNKILSFNEIATIRSILEEQGVKTNLPDEALNLVQPKIAVNEETLLYIIRIPQVNQEESPVVRIIPVTVNGQVIIKYPNYLVKSGNVLYSTSQPYQYIQKSVLINRFTDNCIEPLMEGKKGKCKTKKSHHTGAQLLSDNLLLIHNAKNDLLRSNCGPDDRNITGNLLISFSNCSIHFENQTFTSSTQEVNIKILQGAMHNLFLDQQPQEDPLQALGNMTISNRKKLDHVYLMQFKNQLWNWSLLGGISVSTALTITISVFAFLIYRKSLIKILHKITRRKGSKTQPPTKQSNQDA